MRGLDAALAFDAIRGWSGDEVVGCECPGIPEMCRVAGSLQLTSGAGGALSDPSRLVNCWVSWWVGVAVKVRWIRGGCDEIVGASHACW
jgi:hypothetical protein